MAHTHKQTERYHTANGSTTTFAFPFEYYQKSDVHVTVNGTPKTQGTHYDVNTGGTDVVFKTSPSDHTPANNDVVRIYRDTDVNASKATFAAGSSIRATDLNNNETQLLFSVQEAVEQEIVTADIRDGQITSAKIKDGAVTADQIGANALTYAKIQNVSATDRILGRDSAGAGIIEEITPAELRTMINVEDGSTGDQTNAEIRAAVEAAGDSNVFTDADHTKLDGIAAGAEVNVQSDWNSTSGDNFIINKPTIPAAQVKSDWNASSGMGEILNKPAILELIDEDDFSTNSATKPPSQQSSKAYVDTTVAAHILDEDNFSSNSATKPPSQQSAKAYVDTTVSGHLLDEDNFSTDSATKPPSQQSTKAYITATSQPLDAQLTTLGGASSGTASIIGDSSKTLSADIDELNLLDGKSVVTSVSGSSTDVQLPTAKAVNDQIVSTLQNVGGFYPIDDELKFPNTNPDPNDDAGTIVSIADAGGIVVNGSGVSTTGRTLGGSTVTINGIDSSLNNTTIAAGKGMLVQTTSTLNTYDYHRLVVDEAGVASAQTLVSDFNDRYQVASSAPSNHPDGSALQDGDLWFDTAANTMKVYDLGNTSYAAVTSVGDYKLLTLQDTDGSAADYTNQSFNLRDGSSAANATSAGQLIVSVNGVIQKPNAGTTISGSDEGFCLVDSDTIKFATAPGAGASVFVTLIGSATSVNVPATNSIVEAAIQANVVSEEKLKISNAGSNGQFLSKQSGDSGGLTWATVDTTIADDSVGAPKIDLSIVQGDIIHGTGTNTWTNLAKGTAGQVLKMNSGATAPEWSSSVGGLSGGSDTTYSISCVDGDNTDEEKIRLTAGGSGSGTDDVVLEAGTGLSIARDGDKITFTNTVSDTNTQLTTEQVEDIVGGMLDGTETGISVSYDDTDGNIDFVVSTPTAVTIADESSDTTCFPLFVTAATGDLAPKSGSNLTFNSNTGELGATSFTGDGSSLTGIASTSLDGCGYQNDQTISAGTYSIASGKGMHSVGPITNNGTVTVNGVWVIS